MTALRVSHLSDPRQNAKAVNTALRKTDALDLSSDQLTLTSDRNFDVTGNVNVSGVFEVGGLQVVGARQTGWTADTGTAEKTAHATYTAPTISNPPTQAEVQAIANALQNFSRGQKALKDALITTGVIGA
jgi:hypothetical protein